MIITYNIETEKNNYDYDYEVDDKLVENAVLELLKEDFKAVAGSEYNKNCDAFGKFILNKLSKDVDLPIEETFYTWYEEEIKEMFRDDAEEEAMNEISAEEQRELDENEYKMAKGWK